MSLFVCSKCGCIDNTATSCYWALVRPCKNRVYDESLKGYEGKPLCSECAAIEYSKGDELVVVPGTWHGNFKKEWPTEEEKKHIGKRLWGKKVSDLSHSSFIDKLMYVSSKYGVTIHKIDKWYPSSKTCECGCINKGLSLRDRTWVCPACGAINDRDVLAAKNILRKGISELESKSNSSDSNIGVSCVCIQESHLL